MSLPVSCFMMARKGLLWSAEDMEHLTDDINLDFRTTGPLWLAYLCSALRTSHIVPTCMAKYFFGWMNPALCLKVFLHDDIQAALFFPAYVFVPKASIVIRNHLTNLHAQMWRIELRNLSPKPRPQMNLELVLAVDSTIVKTLLNEYWAGLIMFSCIPFNYIPRVSTSLVFLVFNHFTVAIVTTINATKYVINVISIVVCVTSGNWCFS